MANADACVLPMHLQASLGHTLVLLLLGLAFLQLLRQDSALKLFTAQFLELPLMQQLRLGISIKRKIRAIKPT